MEIDIYDGSGNMGDYKICKWGDCNLLTDKLKESTLILGNGASIAISDVFSYQSLFEKATNDQILNSKATNVFEAIQTKDFELVLNKLRQAAIINNVLGLDSDHVASETYQNIRAALIKVVKEQHISYKFMLFSIDAVRNFMKQFKTVIDLNYDLLVYWAIMSEDSPTMKDCFSGKRGDRDGTSFDYDIEKLREPYGNVIDPTLVFYPHGSLVLLTDKNNAELKIKLKNSDNLLDQIANKWNEEYVPLFVSEGDSTQKEKAIKRSSYLNFIYENLLNDLGENIIIYGWSMSDQDKHLIDKIFKSTKVKTVFLSIFTDGKTEEELEEEQTKIIKILRQRNKNITIKFFESNSEGVWNRFSM